MSLWKSAIVYRRAEAHYERCFREHLQAPCARLPTERWDTLLAQFLDVTAAVRLHEPLKSTVLASLVSERFLRHAFGPANQSSISNRGAPLDVMAALLFAKHWQESKDRLHRAIVPLASEVGPDYSEYWSDALPLAGRQVSEALLKTSLRQRSELESLIRSAHPTRPWIAELVWHARGLWHSSLVKATQSFFATYADHEAQEIDWLEGSW